MKFLGWVAVIVLASACNNTVPTATAYKQQLGSPVVGDPGNGDATGGDATKGQAALTTSCVACHKVGGGGIGHDLVAADADKIGSGAAASNSNHGGVAAAFTTSGKDIAAYLKGGSSGTPAALGNAANGETLLKANCESCHNGTVAVALDAFANIDGKKTDATGHTPDIMTAINANFDDLKAAILARK